MSVYKEGFHLAESLARQQVRIYPDAADFGIPVKKNDANWNAMKQLIDWYGKKETRKEHDYSTGKDLSIEFVLIDEWAVADQRKTLEEATERFLFTYIAVNKGVKHNGKVYDGYCFIEKMNLKNKL